MIALYAAALSYAKLAADKSYDRLLGGSALSIAETLSILDGKVQVDIPYSSLDMLSAAPDDRVFYRVVGPDRRTVTGYSDLPDAPPRRGLRSDSDTSGQFYDASYRGEEVRFVSLAREIAQPGTTGWVYVQVGQTRRARDALTRDLVFGSLAPILFMTVVALGVVWFGVTLALRPLGRLSNELANRQPEDLNPVVTPVPTEIVPVADSINGFMGRLRDNIDTLRSFIGDAAHQIRTPLAVIQAQAQVAEDGDVSEMRGSLVAIRRNAAKLTRLVNQMLSDATVQHRSDVRVFAEFDLLATVQQSVREAVPMAEDSDVRFTSPLSQAPMVGDRLMIGEVVKNLIQNALTHGRSEHAEVSLALVETPDGYLLSVADRGKGIREDDREQVFERFARRNNDEPGAGLGLAIVRRAVDSHHGTITLSDREGGGLLVEIALPRLARRS
ncbi:MAG: sensor histidine kinase [Sphingopyxis sp.]|nr:sensor histidine kinase [Sphingopyxis sp.]